MMIADSYNVVFYNTPFEEYKINGKSVFVKRDDISVVPPGPPLSKIRGVLSKLHAIKRVNRHAVVLVQDDGHSVMGWGTAHACKNLGLKCYNAYPVYMREIENDFSHKLRTAQSNAKELGAVLIPIPAGRFIIMLSKAKEYMDRFEPRTCYFVQDKDLDWYLMHANSIEAGLHTPSELRCGTWILPASKGTSATGVIQGLINYSIHYVVYSTHSRNLDRLFKWMLDRIKKEPDWEFVDEQKYAYVDSVEHPCPFPASEFYDLKAWKWLESNIKQLKEPVIFWNIGA